ncbi:three-helix bundle dimerization domain-containing protein [Williamsia muralis]|uniref:three-helix bundle dimerization domain-containing protein n=1 Tax=Williamsia marianensis TaxID=85044 RepID=UPI000E326D00|nr:hypothetical protein [Williamsia marianensis]
MQPSTARLRLSICGCATAPEDVGQAVDRAHRRFNGEPIRDFVPLLVERGQMSIRAAQGF